MILMNFSIGNPNSWKFILPGDLTNTDLNEFVKRYDSIESELVVHVRILRRQTNRFCHGSIERQDYSFEMLERTIDLSRKLSPIFKGTDQNLGPKIVVHPGGHFEYLKETNRPDQYKSLKKNLTPIDNEGVQLLVENIRPTLGTSEDNGTIPYSGFQRDSGIFPRLQVNACFDTSAR